VRALTEAEARVIAVLLAARPDRERERLRLVKVPRSTYHAVRRRAYEEGWLRDRYIPHPVPLGVPVVTFLLVRPYADRFEELVRTLAADPGAVVVWTGGQVTLSVLFHGSPTTPRKLVERIVSAKLATPPIGITVRANGPAVPVYFDYEGLWSHLVGLSGTLAYPHGLGGGSPPSEEEEAEANPALSSHQRWAISELLRRPFVASADGRESHLVGPFGLPFSQRKILQRGWIVHRTILDPTRLPPYGGRAADQVVFLTGTPRSGARPELLFSILTRESQVYPFLFVVGPDRWMLGALGGSGPPPPGAFGTRRPVLPTVQQYLEGIEIVQEPSAGFSARVDHRYDRLLPAGTPSSPAGPG
jgi:hypothetical protein